MAETVYEHLYSTPEKAAENMFCHGDCFECGFPEYVTCSMTFTRGYSKQNILDWLNSPFETTFAAYQKEKEEERKKFKQCRITT